MNRFNDKGSNFVKSYWELRQLPLSLNEITALELILSYTDQGQEFWMSDEKIGEFIKMTAKSTNNLIAGLVKKGYLSTNTTSNQGKGYGGKTRKIKVNLDFINALLAGESQEKESTPTLEPTLIVEPTPTAPTSDEDEEDDEPFMGEFKEQVNEYSLLIAQAEAAAAKPLPVPETPTDKFGYDHEAVLELIKIDDDLTKSAERAKNRETSIDSNYTFGAFLYTIKGNPRLMEKYRAIVSRAFAA
jgi:hypothetical protein